jgi:GNAT superfamily N-acetyltransferase
MSNEIAVHIAPASESDVPAIHAMINALADHLGLAHEAVVSEENLREALFGSQLSAEVVLAWVGGEAAGFALFYGNYSTFRGQCGIHLEDLYVYPQWRRHGIGRSLLAHLAELTVERGCRRLEWWVHVEDERVVRFYEALGAAAKDEWVVYRLSGHSLQELASEGEDPAF